MWVRLSALLFLIPTFALAESVIAVRTLPAQTRIAAEDLTFVDADIPGALTELAPAIGQETRITIYAGRPLRPQDIQPLALVERNQIVSLIYLSSGLSIRAEGRALQRGSEGEWVRVMNLASKTTVSGRVAPDGQILVGDPN
jgi:flagella basal body P-ring formation protein FlgA